MVDRDGKNPSNNNKHRQNLDSSNKAIIPYYDEIMIDK